MKARSGSRHQITIKFLYIPFIYSLFRAEIHNKQLKSASQELLRIVLQIIFCREIKSLWHEKLFYHLYERMIRQVMSHHYQQRLLRATLSRKLRIAMARLKCRCTGR